MNENLLPSAKLYASQHELELVKPLGSGKDGIVLATKRKANPTDVAVKVHLYSDRFRREVAVYRRLEEKEVGRVLGFNLPQFLGADEALMVIEMTIVERPFVLDFASAHLDAQPEFSAEIWADWEA